jgi:protein-L-isoaspartate(D-aspartate) O-methyltransferase
MVATRIAARGITDPAVLAAMRTVPGEAFVRPDLAELVYDDIPLPLGAGQIISQPYRRSDDYSAAVIHCRSSLRDRHQFGL